MSPGRIGPLERQEALAVLRRALAAPDGYAEGVDGAVLRKGTVVIDNRHGRLAAVRYGAQNVAKKAFNLLALEVV